MRLDIPIPSFLLKSDIKILFFVEIGHPFFFFLFSEFIFRIEWSASPYPPLVENDFWSHLRSDIFFASHILFFPCFHFSFRSYFVSQRWGPVFRGFEPGFSPNLKSDNE